MNPLRDLVREVHRRSLWQVVGIYLAGAWVALQVVEQLAEAAGLPPWIRPFALALLVLGFPVVVATAFVQEGMSRRESVPARPSSADPGGGPPPPAPAPAGAQRLLTWRNAIGGGVVALAVWGLVALGWVLTSGSPPPVGPDAAVANPSAALLPQGEERKRSVAVLPFANLSADPDNAFFADGVHENILTQLSKIGDLRVLSRASMLRYRDTDRSLREIADEVSAGAILQGSVQRVGDRLRISAQLTDPYSEENLWAEQYDGSVEDIFEFQTDVALRVAGQLQATLSPREQDLVARPATASVTALDFYLRGRQAYNRITQEGNEEAIRRFRQAIETDSSFALAWAGLSDGYDQRVQWYGYPVSWADSAEAFAERALALDPNLAEGYKSLGFARSMRGRERAARDAYLRAIELDPNFASAINNVGVTHAFLGEADEALRWWKRAFTLDPNNVLSRLNVAGGYIDLGLFDAAREWLDEAEELTPDDPNVDWYRWWLDAAAAGPEVANRTLEEAYGGREMESRLLAVLADGAMMMGDAAAALRYSERAFELAPEGGAPAGYFDARATRAWALSRDGLDGEALEILANLDREIQDLLDGGADDPFLRYKRAQVQALRGAREAALEDLLAAFEGQMGRQYRIFDRDPILADLRDDPRVVAARREAEAESARQRAAIEAEERGVAR